MRFDLDHPYTQQQILLQVLRFFRSPMIPVHAKKQKENSFFS